MYVPIEQVISLDGGAVRLSSARLDLRGFERRDGEVLLRADVSATGSSTWRARI